MRQSAREWLTKNGYTVLGGKLTETGFRVYDDSGAQVKSGAQSAEWGSLSAAKKAIQRGATFS